MADITSNLEAWYKFDGDATDSSGNGNNGTLENSPTFTTGKIGSAAVTLSSASSQTVDAGSVANSYPVTYALWVKTTSTTDNSGLMNKYSPGSGNGTNLYMRSGHAQAWHFVDYSNNVWGGNNGLDSGFIADGTWHHLAFTVDASGGKLYLDGTLVDSLSWDGTPGTPTSSLGFSIGEYEAYFDGSIDDVRIYSRALSSDDVADLYAYTGSSSGGLAFSDMMLLVF